MDKDVILQVDVAVNARVSTVGSRSVFGTKLRKRASVMVRGIDPSEAPVSIEATWPEGGKPGKLSWRTFDGAYWRPVLGGDDRPMDEGGFQAALLATDTPEGRKEAGEWRDYPFRLHAPGDNMHGTHAIGSWTAEDGRLRVRESDEAEAVRLAQVRASRDLLMLDGVLHVRSQPPVWSVGCERAWWSPGRVSLTMPDLDNHVPGSATFPLDRLDEAMAFAAERVERVTSHPLYERLGHPADPRVEHDGSSVELGGVVLPRTDADDRARIADWVEQNLRNAEFRSFGRAFIKAYGDFLVTADGDDDDAAAEAVTALAAAGDPEWVRTWPVAFDMMESVKALAHRAEFERRVALREDAEAFLAPGL